MIDIMLLSCGSEKKKIPAETFLSAYRPDHTYTVTRGAYGKPLLSALMGEKGLMNETINYLDTQEHYNNKESGGEN